jgi:hypothetical protein
MRELPGFLTSKPLGRWETLKVSLKNPKGVTKDRTRNLRSDSQWSNQLSYRATANVMFIHPERISQSVHNVAFVLYN